METMIYPDTNHEVVNFDYNNRMLPVYVSGTDTYAQSIAYDSANRMKEIIRGVNKIDTDYLYNPWNVDGGRLLNITSTQVSPASNLQNLTYDYDPVGNINAIVDSLSGPQTQSFTYDALDRVLTSSATGGSNGLYSEGYEYYDATGNLKKKNDILYTYNSGHAHGVSSLANGNSYAYDANGNMTSRNVGGQSFTLTYDSENRLVSVTGAATASFSYDADGKQVIGTVNGVTTYYVGNHYEVKNDVVTKYYFAGATRLALRTGDTLSFLLGDHIGSSSVRTNANGGLDASALYKAFGETRYTYGSLGTDYHFTGQREEISLGIYWFQSRWYDGYLNRFIQPDSIVPLASQGTQAWDRYAFVNNNPVRYNDPTGHMIDQGDDGGCTDESDCTPPPPPQTCDTVTCRADNGDIGAILELLFPSHWGWNVQAGGSFGLPIGIDIGVEVNASVVYYWRTDQLIGNVDFGVGPGVGVKLPVPGQIAATTGPVLGWGQSDPNAGDISVSGGASLAAEGAVAVSASVPVNLTSNGPEFYVDPVYGQIPVTAYGGVGVGCCGAGGNVMASGSIYQSDLSILLPWHWW
jgi:RHS repeat-associated protein